MSDECNSSQSSDVSTLVSLDNELLDLTLEDSGDNSTESINSVDVAKAQCTKKELTEMTKVVVRRLPPNMTKETFIKTIEPVPEYDYLYVVKPDGCNAPHLYSRAYINFKNVDDVYTFKEKFDNYVFLDQKGVEYPAVVEYSNFQRIPKKRANRKKDPKCGTLDTDPMFKDFLECQDKPTEKDEKVEYGYKFEVKKVSGAAVLTPLVEYVQQKRYREQKNRFKDEQRRIRENERKRAKEDERKRKRLADKTKRDQNRKETKIDTHRKDPTNIGRKTYVSDSVKKLNNSGGYQSKGGDMGNVRKPYGDTLRKNIPSCGQQLKIGDIRKTVGIERADGDKCEKQDKFSGVRRHDWDGRQSQNYNYKQGNRYESTLKKHAPNVKDVHKKGFTSQHFGKCNVPTTPTKVRTSFTQEDETGKKSPEGQEASISCKSHLKPKFEKSSSVCKKNEDINKKPKGDDAKQVIAEVVGKEQKADVKLDDPRKQRQIRNKDRPDLQIYRPGMGRLSKDRINLNIDTGGKGDVDNASDPSNNNLKSKSFIKKPPVSAILRSDTSDTRTSSEN